MAPKWYEWPMYAFATHRQFKRLAHTGTPNISKNPSPESTTDDLEGGDVHEKKQVDTRGTYLIDETSSPEIDPKNWPTWKKVLTIIQLSSLGLNLTFASSVSATAGEGAAVTYGVSQAVANLSGTAIFLIGFAWGALPLAPLSEELGRTPVYLWTLLMSSILEVGAGRSTHVYGQLLCRFFAGFTGATPLSNSGGSVVDISRPSERNFLFVLFASSAFIGPVLGPVIGGLLTQYASWEWSYYLTAIWGVVVFLHVALFVEETYAPVLYREKAKALRRKTGDKRWHSKYDNPNLKEVFKVAMVRPFNFLLKEPIVIFFTIYISIVYFLLFGFLESYAVIFGEWYELDVVWVGVAFVPMIIGIVAGGIFLIPFCMHYDRIIKKHGSMQPEEHLKPLLVGAVGLPISLFWLGWTCYPDRIPVYAPVSAGVLFGFSLFQIFVGTYQIIMSSYARYAASALAGFTFVRYNISGGSVMASAPMFRNMTPHWAATLLGIISALLIPVAYTFYKKGPAIRARSQWAV
ncbi:hypothetical protein E3P92_00826 [Wallemia ichthyophaga]|uniref:Major facilitator superfamily (MFS) profile domain-containing protein n=2 Tax=Wallemia ichthyophaga TaxID=245174 RepID=A0A4T0HUI2_WALIC|nr:uncharacterized protein J056_003773 [Wallemia ichthyophaga EXF-994]TIA83650.1 hypothetical protein E3P98_00553 [Wallemia ichthyophaga]EOR02097.1 hypothetical protein J056_003773 [Wallemia ichthyophaga EXF-994]TIA93769.1 hypothetical protein E3P97_00731 [Wallemia ichthyophaga]TIB02696.1 hypothetical protein E3P95_00780 [Wallemia ichthyophaga]TIB03594.1 hypothetical protein E3P94_00912 [Wallemia ichthyophaga]